MISTQLTSPLSVRTLAAHTLVIGLCVSLPGIVSAQALPSGWTAADVGIPAVQGAATFDNGTFRVRSAGADVRGTSDQFTFVYRQLTGDGDVVARVEGIENTAAWAKSGVMIRESLAAEARHAFATASAANGLAFQRRRVTGGVSVHTSGGTGAVPVWVKLERRGSIIRAFRSADGATWTLIGTDAISLTKTVFAGLVVSSQNVDVATEGMFASVAVTPVTAVPSGPLPSGWTAVDIGGAQAAGSASYSNGTYAVKGAGRDIWGYNDEFHYVYRRVDGDTDIVARVTALENVAPWTKAGVMIRDALTPNAAHFSMIVSGARGVAFQRRPDPGGPSVHTSGGAGRAPFWVRLERRGSQITAFQSANGSTWTQVGTGTLALPSVYVGLAVSSRRTARTATALFESVTVRTPGPNQPPAVALTAPTNNASFVAPISINIAATASDTDGTVARVDFYSGTTLIGTDTTSPYGYAWTGMGAGTYALKAVATDSGGATTESATRTVTVGTAGTQPPTVSLTVPTTNAVAVPAALPSGWASVDVGSPQVAGSAQHNAGTYSVRGGGADITGTTDQFHYAYRQVSGDVDIVSRVATVEAAHTWTKAGVMIRESLTANAAHASVFVTPGNDISFQRRPSTGAVTQYTAAVANVAPYWVRLQRRGGTITAATSPNGTTWSTAGSVTLAPTTIYIGLAVTAHNATAAATATFDNVVVGAPTTNPPPTVTLTAPANGATFTAPATVTMAATASDTNGGTIAAVEFYAGTTLIGSDTTNPYSVTWNNAPAGNYSLTAVARDNGGATTTSAARTITVTGAANQPPTVSLTAPANGATFTAPASVTVTAMASDPNGTIASVRFFAGTTLIGTDTSSPYGVTWSNVAAGSYSLTAVAQDNAGATTTSAARTITVTAALPSGWASVDVGSPQVAGSAQHNAGTYSVRGGGADITGTTDQFHYAYRQVSGDVDIVSRVATVEAAHTWTKAGVMIRESLTANAAHASVFVTPGNDISFQRRPSTGAVTQYTAAVANVAPYWVRLQRRGGTITAATSPNGTTWSTAGSVTLAPTTIYIGLAVTAHNATAAATATFDNVVVGAPTTNPPPTVTLTAPANGATFTAPATVTMAATASDTNGGTIAAVEFYAGTTLIGSDTTNPYSVTWNNAPAGNYSLTAVARDNGGATTTSAARTITVTGAANQPPTVSLTAPANGATFTAPASVTVTAMASDPNGTIASVRFFAGTTLIGTDTSSPYGVTWSNVAAGSYSLTAVAQDNAGATTTSAARTITVTTPLPQPYRAVFVASSNHNTAVDRYVLNIYPSGSNPDTATPVATRDLGKPAVVNGECNVDVSPTVQALAPGSYIATVTAVGPGGSARSTPSAAFTR